MGFAGPNSTGLKSLVVGHDLGKVSTGGAGERPAGPIRQVVQQLGERAALDTLTREHLKLLRLADDTVNKMERPGNPFPEALTQRRLGGIAELALNPLPSPCLNFVA